MICPDYHNGSCSRGPANRRMGYKPIPKPCRIPLEPGGSRRRCCVGCPSLVNCGSRPCADAKRIVRAR